ncbi:hypothetical protein ACFW9T_04835 [Streptomyces massasporeus]|uniref:hypothetical protein n=1 Tax=Streptomyces massasporeus TaxID=67324 RepID=UPI00367998D3
MADRDGGSAAGRDDDRATDRDGGSAADRDDDRATDRDPDRERAPGRNGEREAGRRGEQAVGLDRAMEHIGDGAADPPPPSRRARTHEGGP